MRLVSMIFALAISTTPALAAEMSGKDVKDMMSAGKLRFLAGSVGTFNADGTYVFRHQGGSSEKGTYTVSKEGVVTLYDTRSKREIMFYFDKKGNKKPALIYLNGPGKGKRYPMR